MAILEFQNTLFRTEREMLDAVAYAWLSADGLNDHDTMVSFIAEQTTHQLASECIQAWGLDRPEHEGDEQTWMEKRRVTFDDIQEAFARLVMSFNRTFSVT